ncbi:regulator of chromosome condensation 1/beta-lactamase-inhibitor protein II [Phlebopus sp. FC_14]|nr:regulator of chromosome condensation 1/beta-lactamase-inhibitor protein II [Phlebopus sp. FC_14]
MGLADVPVELLLDNLLPLLPIPDLLRLGATNRLFNTLCNDDTFWKRKLQQDFNFSDEDTARSSGWKFIYRGLSHPRTYVWGESSKGRLGLTKFPRRRVGDVPFPAELRFAPGVRIVHLAAAGMSFFALDSKGSLWIWGALNGSEFALQQDGYSAPGRIAYTPLRLSLPAATRAISCGRLHATSLDENLHVWTLLSFGHPFRLITPLLDAATPDSTPLQVACGWNFSSVLTRGGDVFVWWPFSGEIRQLLSTQNADDPGSAVHAVDGVIPCAPRDLRKDPRQLPELPRLPPLISGAQHTEIRLVKIAALENSLVGLTNHGHVLKIAVQDHAPSQPPWEYLPRFSESDQIKGHLTSASCELHTPQVIRISHISAQFHTFVAYSTGSSSVVLMGSQDTGGDSAPRILPALQNINVISVVLGDYHFGALTSTGKLLTWGSFSRGALGLGDPVNITPGNPGGYSTEQTRQFALTNGGPPPPPVEEPTEVAFDHDEQRSRKRFCFAATAAGWHMGALVIDLEPEPDDLEDSTLPMPGGFPSSSEARYPSDFPYEPGQWGTATVPMFRVGFAGRGAHRGWPRGRGRGH